LAEEGILKEINERFSCRDYIDKETEDDKLQRVVEAGNKAPSPFNNQPWDFILVTDKEKISRVRDLMKEVIDKDMKSFIKKRVFKKSKELLKKYHMTKLEPEVKDYECPALILVLENLNRNHSEWPFPIKMTKIAKASTYMSIGCAIQNMLIQAKAEGLDTCVTEELCALKAKQLKKVFNIPNNRFLLVIITLGYRSEEIPAKSPEKLSLEEVVHYNTM